MKEIVTAQDIRALADQGEHELMLREHTVLTDAALDAARMHGVRLVEGGATSGARPREDDVVAARLRRSVWPLNAAHGDLAP